MLHRLSVLVLLLVAGCSANTNLFAPWTRVPITKYGAVGDGKTVNTKAIQSAIDSLAARGGGTLVVPKGTFLSGALFFKQGVNLLVEQGGILKGTTVQADYPLVHTRWEGVEGMHTCAFLNFDHMTNVTVSGQGTIDGSGDLWLRNGRGGFGRRGFGGTRPTTGPFARGGAGGFGRGGGFGGGGGFGRGAGGRGATRPGFVFQQVGRPRLICFSNCDGVHISDLHLQKQAIWCLHILYSQNVVVDNLNIRATLYIPSSDGIDIDSSRNVLVRHCDIATYDDNITIKSGKDDDGRRVNRPSENITIENCTIGIGAGIAMGSEVTGSIHHVLVENCTFNGTDAAARFKSQPSRGGDISDIVFRDITMHNVGRAVEMLMDWDLRLERAVPTNKPTDTHDVRLIDFTGTARTGGVIHGLPNGPIHDVTFEDCNFTANRGLVIDNANDIDTTGLKMKVTNGPAIMTGPTTLPIPPGMQVRQ